MFNAFLALLSPLLLVFGLYHLFTWFNIFRINERAYWRRVGLTAAISHFLLATGFFLFAWFDHRGIAYLLSRMDYATFVFQHSAFWQMLAIFDTAAMLGNSRGFFVDGTRGKLRSAAACGDGHDLHRWNTAVVLRGRRSGSDSPKGLGRIEDRRRRRRMVSVNFWTHVPRREKSRLLLLQESAVIARRNSGPTCVP